MTIAGVVLAAGGGSRFEGATHKLLADFRGRPVVAWVIEAAVGAGFNQLYVVQGAVDLTSLVSTVGSSDITIVRSVDWDAGQSQSILSGVGAADDDGHDAIVIGLGDQPMIPSSAWRTVGAARGPIVAANFGGERRPPVKLERSVWGQLPASGDDGARALMSSRPDLVSEVACDGNPADIDTLKDLETWS